jgi:AraC-like DNA-binding protein
VSYAERPSRRVPGAVVWRTVADGNGRVIPDGCSDLLLIGERLVIAGPDTTAKVGEVAAGTPIHGLRFAPGWGPSVYGVPADRVRDQRVPLDQVWDPATVRGLEARLADGDVTLEAIAVDRLARATPPAPIVEAARCLAAGESVDATAEAVGLSPRQLRRLANESFGYGPKLLGRVLRLNQALDRVRAGRPAADAAAETGYVDQAHLCRDVKDLTGVTLGQLVGSSA